MDWTDIMDYSTPVTIFQSGERAFKLGVAKDDCPIDSRTHANAIHWWNDGWDSASEMDLSDAEWVVCKGENCHAVNGYNHSHECIAEHDGMYY